MKQYHSRLDTPLKFHRFVHYFSVPIGIIVNIGSLISTYKEMEYLFWGYVIEYAILIAAIVLGIICFVGFFHWKAYAWYGMMLLLAVNVVFSSFLLVLKAIYSPSEIATALGSLIGSVLYAVPVYIYYWKRKGLFVGDRMQSGDEVHMRKISDVRYCWRCGVALPAADSQFCNMCGTKQSDTVR